MTDSAHPIPNRSGGYTRRYTCIPVVRINASRVEEIKAGEVSLDDNDCFLVSDSTEDFYRDLVALSCAPVDEEVVLLHGDSVGIVKPFEPTIVSWTITH